MCGIAGTVNRHTPVGFAALERMTDLLAHRGPDGRGVWVDGNVGFGHRRLRIIGDTHQPLHDDRLTCVYNGETYNYPDLEKTLGIRVKSDTDILLPAYRRWGLRMFERMNGMFALAIRDGNKLHLARDRFGEKPLYYTHTDTGFKFASEIKALLDGPVRVSTAGLADYTRYQFVHGNGTLFDGVYKVEPGTVVTLDTESWRLTTTRWWSLPTRSEESPDDLDHLADLVADAVRIRTRADAKIGAYVSGGLDSSTVYKFAGPYPAFTGAYVGDEYNELPYAYKVSRSTRVVWPSPDDFERDFKRIMWHMDEPAAGPGVFSQWMVAKEASRYVKVCLGGQGGDEVFGGYVRHMKLAGHPKPAGYEAYTVPRQYHGMTLGQACRYDAGAPLESLLHVEDRMSMAHSLESRLPLLDHRVAELVFSRPERFRWSGDTPKGALKHVARGVVPDEIIDRADKKGFPTPFVEWAQGPLRDFVGDYTSGIDADARWGRGLWGRLCLGVWREVFNVGDLAALNERAA